jgi:hypothetical protein
MSNTNQIFASKDDYKRPVSCKKCNYKWNTGSNKVRIEVPAKK